MVTGGVTSARPHWPRAGYHFETKGEFWLVGLGSCGPYKQAREWVLPLWEALLRRQHELPPVVDRSVYVSPYHGRETEFTCYVGLAAREEVVDLPPGMRCIRIPTHTYAVGSVRGSRAEIDEVYRTLPEWAEAQGRRPDKGSLWLEIHPQAPTHAPHAPPCFDVYLPVLPLGWH
ncbi:MAG TPA: GyrI-like domain-containing protein [Chloroflexota bacterium]|jgi:AraC family transcriptional regulator|nr:GyrI-like domain-containing protein [Chloroflexota bacterium]